MTAFYCVVDFYLINLLWLIQNLDYMITLKRRKNKQQSAGRYSFCRGYNITKWQNKKVDVKDTLTIFQPKSLSEKVTHYTVRNCK